MHCDVSAPVRAPFLQTPEALIDDVAVPDSAFRLLQGMVKLPPRNRHNSDAVARKLRMGKEKTNAARKALRALGHWHARKRRNPRGELRDQRLASLTPLRTKAEIEAGWAAAEEAMRLGKDTAASRKLGVRILNSAPWLAPQPAAGTPAPRPTRPRPQEGDQTDVHHTPHPLPTTQPQPQPQHENKPKAQPETGLSPLTGPLATYASRAETALLQLRRSTPQLALAVPEARELAQIAGHYLLRGEGPEIIRAVVAQGLPPDGIRSPRGFVRQRLLRYLPPLPPWSKPPKPNLRKTEKPPPAPTSQPEPPLPRPGSPADLIRQGQGWRTAFRAAAQET
ncbi:hypothetical protein [Streptomyces gobiensis]|uniref:hypothetical protein n=1 Tax=Streptomyces gobiensis TaxID=2875706 RepID=UPI001E4B4346|nr:hypothetical protein [Streptomyces gobiensis]UGY92632.1 hypothetical protein test1122_13500 [Streptomyces gobiensis]